MTQFFDFHSIYRKLIYIMGVKTGIIKLRPIGPKIPVIPIERKTEVVEKAPVATKNKKNKKTENIMTEEQMMKAMGMADELNPQVKMVKKDRGLIERTESSKIVLTEDNRQVLND